MSTRIKLCGLRRPADIEAANALMPEYVGFVFAPSKRRVTPEEAAALRKNLAPGITPVGVFVNEEAEGVADLYRAGIIGMAQLHGDEDGAYIARLKELAALPVIKAVAVTAGTPAPRAGADYILFDTPGPARGGSGQAFDWTLLEGVDRLPYFLAGGLHPGNVAEAVRTLHPFAVDVSSGVETDGTKDPVKMAAFVQAVRTCL